MSLLVRQITKTEKVLRLLTLLASTILLLISQSYAQIRINEVCASNSESLYDEDSDTPDWIELYNYSDKPVNLSSWKISDKPNLKLAWQFPDTVLKPNEYLLVYASGKNKFKENLRITSNGLNTITNGAEDNLSMAYLELDGDNEIRIKYNSFDFNVDSITQYALAGLILKDELSPNSRMVSNFVSQSDKNQVFILNRLKRNEYRDQMFFPSRLDLEDYEFSTKKTGDSVIITVFDKYNYPIFRESFYLPNMNKYYIGLTVLSRDKNQKFNLNVDSITLNGDKVNQDDFQTISFHNTQIEIETSKRIHTDFKLSKKEESLFLFNNEILIDSLLFYDLDFDESLSYNNGLYEYTKNVTPGSSNSEGFTQKSQLKFENELFLFENEIKHNRIEDNIFYDTNFKKPFNFTSRLNDKLFKETNLISVQKQEEGKAPSTIDYLPLINKKDILFEGIHVFLNTDSFELFNPYYGPLVATFSDKRIDTYCTILKENKLLFKDYIKLTKHGSLSSVGRLQNSVRLYFDDELESLFGRSLFSNKSKSYGNKLNIRNAGNDTELYIRDLFAQHISKNLNLEWSDYSPSFLYINNEFWGLYNIRQRIDNDFLSERYNIDSDEINFIENDLMIKYGTNSQLLEFRKEFYVKDAETILSIADSLFNLKSFIDYLFVETYTLNHDWPYNNVHFWGTKERKWSFILNDLDFAFRLKGAGPSINNMNSIFGEEKFFIIELFNILVKNQEFKYKFFNRVCDLINTDFSTEVLSRQLDSIRDVYQPLIKYQNEKWPETVVNWDENINIIYDFIEKRPDYYLEFANIELKEPGIATLNLSTYPNNSGTFKVNTIKVDTSEWSGRYFQTIPVTITAVPNHGMKFVKWNHDSLGTEPTITTTIPESIELEAIFEKVDLNEQVRTIVINEIMYNADNDKDTKDWIEIYNAGNDAVNLKGWSIIDEDTTHPKFIIKEDYQIQPSEFVIMTKELEEFEEFISITNKKFGDFDFGIGGDDIIKLIDENGITHDSVNYDNDSPWPEDADGTGYTIELINPTLDNNIGTNWKISKMKLGTAGGINSTFDSVQTSVNINYLSSNLILEQHDRIINITSNEFISDFGIYTITGKKMYMDKDPYRNTKQLTLDLNNLDRGVYLLIVYSNTNTETKKILLK